MHNHSFLGNSGLWLWWRAENLWIWTVVGALGLLVGYAWIRNARSSHRPKEPEGAPAHEPSQWIGLLFAASLTLAWFGLVLLLPALTHPDDKIPAIWESLNSLGIGLIGAAVIGGFIGYVQESTEDRRILENRRLEERQAISAERRDIRNELRTATVFPNYDGRRRDLSNLYLARKTFTEANLTEANLRYATLRDADLSGALLLRADLQGADLEGADLTGADFREARLPFARLQGAVCIGADFRGTDLSRVELDDETILDDCQWDPSTKWPPGFAPPPSGRGSRSDYEWERERSTAPDPRNRRRN